MKTQNTIADRQIIIELLDGDEEYVGEFALASIESFTDFKNQFEVSLKEQDLEALRKAGHKIKPVAQMLKLESVVTMYETAKTMLEENAPAEDLAGILKEMNSYCNRLIRELGQI